MLIQYYGWGPPFGWWPIFIIMILVFYFLLLVGVVLLIWWLWNRTKSKYETPLAILKKRYAKGEITKEEFDRMRQELG